MIRPSTVFNTLVAALFLLSAALQLNDPDPLRWIAIYAAAAVACLVAGRVPWAGTLAAAVGLIAFVWAATMVSVLHEMRFADLFKTMKAQTPVIEEAREFLGLALVCGFMAVLALRARRDRQRA